MWNKKSQLALNDSIEATVEPDTIDEPASLSKMEMLLRQKELENPETLSDLSDSFILSELNKIGKIKRSTDSAGTIAYWAKKKDEMKELYELSTILNAVPVTQVTVERAFSSLAFILTALRNSMAADTLENILIIRLNKEIFFKILPFCLI